MAEYIEREAAINAVLVGDIDKDFPRMDISARLHDIHAADVRPVVRGRWEKPCASLVWNSYGLYTAAYKCDKCGELNIAGTNFCPNCGAWMEES